MPSSQSCFAPAAPASTLDSGGSHGRGWQSLDDWLDKFKRNINLLEEYGPVALGTGSKEALINNSAFNLPDNDITY